MRKDEHAATSIIGIGLAFLLIGVLQLIIKDDSYAMLWLGMLIVLLGLAGRFFGIDLYRSDQRSLKAFAGLIGLLGGVIVGMAVSTLLNAPMDEMILLGAGAGLLIGVGAVNLIERKP